MLEKYKFLNLQAKEYLDKELDTLFYRKYQDEKLLKRCHYEMDILFNKGLLFIIEFLYRYKISNSTNYHFRGTINNLLVLYVLEITNVDPIKYNLPYELFSDNTVNVDLIKDCFLSLLWFLEKEYNIDLKIVYGFHAKEDINEIDMFEDNHYLLIPNDVEDDILSNILLKINNNFLLETVEDYRNYKNEFLTIRIDEKPPITNYKKVGLENVLACNFEKEIAKILKPKTINDYIKVKSIGHGANVWKFNQDILVKDGKINLDNLIATREDILEYLLKHSINRDIALEMVNFIRKGRQKDEPRKWKKYVKIMKKNNCEDLFINIFSKILFIFGRGQAVSECLFVLDERHYIDK